MRRRGPEGHAWAVAFFGFPVEAKVDEERPLEQDGCRLEQWGLGAWATPGWYLAVSDSMSWGADAAAGAVDPVRADPAWRAMLERFCAGRGLPFQEPGWHLAGGIPG